LNPETNTSKLESKFDKMVYKLYGLTDDEQIGFKPMMSFDNNYHNALLSKEQAAEYYWKKFIEYI
jgi:hypothetical protein